MKKLILAAFALTTAASVFAQGTIWLGNRFAQTPAVTTHIYAPLSAADTEAITGNAATDNPIGTTLYGGRKFIGADGNINAQYGAATTLAQYVAVAGAGQPVESLQPVGQTTSFRTGTSAGVLTQITSTINQFAPAAVGPFTFSIVAWDNFSGAYPTWELAKPAWEAGLIAAGMMTPFTINSLGGNTTPQVYPNQVGGTLTSFNLYFIPIPEPSSMVLAGLGAAALLIFRRRN